MCTDPRSTTTSYHITCPSHPYPTHSHTAESIHTPLQRASRAPPRPSSHPAHAHRNVHANSTFPPHSPSTMPIMDVVFQNTPPDPTKPHAKVEVDRRLITYRTTFIHIPPAPTSKLVKPPKIARYLSRYTSPPPDSAKSKAEKDTSSSSATRSDAGITGEPPATTTTPGKTKSKRAKPAFVHPVPVKVASLTPLMRPIVARCFASTSDGSGSSGSSADTPAVSPPVNAKRHGSSGLGNGGGNGHASPHGLKRKAQQMAHPVQAWPVVHPYSRATDTRNDRSDVPSPREVARAEQAEKDRAKAREISAAAARAAAAAKRKKTTAAKAKSNSSGNGTGKTRSVSPTKEKLAEDGLTLSTAEPASYDSPAPSSSTAAGSALPPRGTMKRTRSTGLGISTLTANAIGSVGPAVSSPLRAVTGPTASSEDDTDEHGPERKKLKSRLGAGSRRANTDSPPGATSLLKAEEAELLKTEPIPHAKVLPAQVTNVIGTRQGSSGAAAAGLESTAMRRVASAGGEGNGTVGSGSKKMTRSGSTGSADGAKDRAKREVNLPGRLRDYDMKVGTMA